VKLSDRAGGVSPASSIELNEKVYQLLREGRDPIILSYGEAPFESPQVFFNHEMIERGAHYSDSRGTPELRARLARYHFERNQALIDPDRNIIVTAGSKAATYLTFLTLLNPGDKVLLHEPSWVSYREHARLVGAAVEYIPMHDEVSTYLGKLETNSTARVLVLNNPNNPRGHLYGADELTAIAEITKTLGIFLVIDESYSDFVKESSKFLSATRLLADFDHVVSLNSLSKNFGLSGWRIGYVVCNPKIATAINSFNQHLITCAPTILQLAFVENFDSFQTSAEKGIADLESLRPQVAALLDKHGFRRLDGDNTFYFFVDGSSFMRDAKEFTLQLLEEQNVAVIPGNAYGANTASFFRVSFGAESLVRIDEGLSRISAFIGSNHGRVI
jgi:aspartate/methionine/tyrosine aminotransferase